MDITYADPRQLDGDPYEVAGATVQQTKAVAELLEKALEDCYAMCRVAEMQREILATDEADAKAFDATPVGQNVLKLTQAVKGLQIALTPIKAAAEYNPESEE